MVRAPQCVSHCRGIFGIIVGVYIEILTAISMVEESKFLANINGLVGGLIILAQLH